MMLVWGGFSFSYCLPRLSLQSISSSKLDSAAAIPGLALSPATKFMADLRLMLGISLLTYLASNSVHTYLGVRNTAKVRLTSENV